MSYSDTKYHLISVNPEQNRNRFYSIIMEHDLFGFSITRCWGRIGTKGKMITKNFGTIELAEKEIKRLLRVREIHGYQTVTKKITEIEKINLAIYDGISENITGNEQPHK